MARISQTKRCQHLDQHMVTFTGAGFTCCVSLLDKKLGTAIHWSETFNFDSLARAVQLQETPLTAHFCLCPIPKLEVLCMIYLDFVCLNLKGHLCSCDHKALLLSRHTSRLQVSLLLESSSHSRRVGRCHVPYFDTALVKKV